MFGVQLLVPCVVARVFQLQVPSCSRDAELCKKSDSGRNVYSENQGVHAQRHRFSGMTACSSLPRSRVGRKGAPGTTLGTAGMSGGVCGGSTTRAARAGEAGGDVGAGMVWKVVVS